MNLEQTLEDQIEKPLALQSFLKINRIPFSIHYELESEKLFVAAGDDVTLATKAKSLFGFGNKKAKEVPNGCISVYHRVEKKDGQVGAFLFDQDWTAPSPGAVSVCCYDKEGNRLLSGDGMGVLHLYGPDSSNSSQYVETHFAKLHEGRVEKAFLDPSTDLIYSIGADRKFKVFSIKKKSVVSEFEVSNKKPTDLLVDTKDGVAYVADLEGNVKIIDIVKSPPSCINNIKVGKEPISCLDVSNHHIFAGCPESGKIVVNLFKNPRDSSSQATPKYTYKGYNGITTLKYWKSRGELYVGHSNGVLAVFNRHVSTDTPFCRL